MSGTAVAQAIGFALTPVISRLFSPSDFGVAASFFSVSGIISAGCTLQYTQAIMLPKEKSDALNLAVVSIGCVLVISTLLMFLCLSFADSINKLINNNGFWALTLLVLSTLFGGINTVCQAWCIRVKHFKNTSISQIIRSVSSNGMQIGTGFINCGPVGLILSNVFAEVLASINLVCVVLPDIKRTSRLISWERIKSLANEYRDFPIYSASQNVINSLSSGFPVLLLSCYYETAIVGAYGFGLRLLQTPMSLVLGALRQVLFQKAAETQHLGGNLAPLYIKTTIFLFLLALVPLLVLMLYAPQLFSFLFGKKWLFAGECTRYLVPWMLFYFCNLPAVLFARLIRIQRQVFYYDCFLLFVRVTTLVIGGTYCNALMTIFMFSIVGALMNIILIIYVGIKMY